ncbi:MAG: hypothetical protein ISS91_01380 [Candidatus Omnitrophica bacterium]|nr:hypothetical protein [Candidatus Omnitrophota bacterium]
MGGKIVHGTVVIILISFLFLVPAYAFETHKGMCYATWTEDSFSNKRSDESLKSMAESGVKNVAIVVTRYQEEFDSPLIKKTERTPTDASLRNAIRKAHKNGMEVMLKPHVDLEAQAGTWRADINFATDKDWGKWFKSYTKYVTRYAKIAEEEKVEFFCVGTELSCPAEKTEYWKEMVIPAVRKNFSGKITYAANWDNFQNIKFWDDLDYAGVDAYFPLAKNENPTLEELKEGWRPYVAKIEAWQKEINKPVLFTEIGYTSSNDSAKRPWESATGSDKPNMKLQSDCYQAFFDMFWDKSWFAGVYWWKWNTYAGAGGENNSRFTPQNKPALRVVKAWYEKDRERSMIQKAIESMPAGRQKLVPYVPPVSLPAAALLEVSRLDRDTQEQRTLALARIVLNKTGRPDEKIVTVVDLREKEGLGMHKEILASLYSLAAESDSPFMIYVIADESEKHSPLLNGLNVINGAKRDPSATLDSIRSHIPGAIGNKKVIVMLSENMPGLKECVRDHIEKYKENSFNVVITNRKENILIVSIADILPAIAGEKIASLQKSSPALK